MTIKIDMYFTLAMAVTALWLGRTIRKRISFFADFCIPYPVIGGLIFSVIVCILHVYGIAEITFDETFKEICMLIFFTSVGFQADVKLLKKGGAGLAVLIVMMAILICCQNLIAVGIAKILGLSALTGMTTGSIPMLGGHGTSAAFGPLLEKLGVEGATTLATASATLGLVAGSIIGGPIGRRLIIKNGLVKEPDKSDYSEITNTEAETEKLAIKTEGAYQLIIAMALGTLLSRLLAGTGMTFPMYFGSMIVAAIIRNAGELSGTFKTDMKTINGMGEVSLSLFLGIAMISIKLWQLADLALPLLIMLLGQVVFMYVFTYFGIFNVMGRNYDAAIMCAGVCGFGLGATPNAMANMQALTSKYKPSAKAYLIIPVVGSMFNDIINSILLTMFINIFS